MSTVYLEPNDPKVQALRQIAFPGYTGRQFELHLTPTISFSETQWSGGTKSSYHIIDLASRRIVPVPEAPFLQRSALHEKNHPLPVGYVVVEHKIFCGKDLGLTFHVNPETVEMKALGQAHDATRAEKIVLAATGLKSSYGGIRDLRYHESHEETGIGHEEYEAAKESCIRKGWLNKAGAITVAGRNVRGTSNLRDFREMTKGR